MSGTFDQALNGLLRKCDKCHLISIQEILASLSGQGRAVILILLSLPFCQPLQIPGVSVPFGIAIAIIGLRMAFGKRIWLPHRLLQKPLSCKTIKKVAHMGLSVMKRLNRFIHPRLRWISEHRAMNCLSGTVICLAGAFLAIPLPIPLSNIIAGWAIFLISLGMLEKDGLVVALGYSAFLAGAAFFGFLIMHFSK